MSDVYEGVDIIDSRDVIARIAELEDERDIHEEERSEAGSGEAWEDEFPDEAEELEALKKLAEAGETMPDWHHGSALICDSYFETYARDMAEDIGAIGKDNQWPATCIDWEQAAADLQQDYTPIEFGDTTYWVRS